MSFDEEDEDDEPGEPLQCEECTGNSERACGRCGRRICLRCAKNHRRAPVESWMVQNDQKPPFCVQISKGQERFLQKLPLNQTGLDKLGERSKESIQIMIKIGYAKWDVNGLLRRSD